MNIKKNGTDYRKVLCGITVGVAALLAAASLASADEPASEPGPYKLETNRHLFIDDFLIAEKENVCLRVNPPQRKELVITADRPWERNGITSYCNVFWDPNTKEYRLYYVPIHLDSQPAFRLALATSKDGVHWDKPNLHAVQWQGSTENNIVIDGQREGTVLIDPNGSPDKRYVFLSSEPTLRTRLFTSPDGIHWTMQPTLISTHHSDSQISSFWDEQLGKYVHFPRVGHRGRAVGRVETARMDEPWPESIPMVLSADDHDPPDMDLYTNSAQKYAMAENVYVAFPTPYYHYNAASRAYLNKPVLRRGGKANDGTIDTQLAVSRDGKAWTRYRTPYVSLYQHEALDLKINMVFPGLVYRDSTIDQYFGGYAFTHGDTQARVRFKGRQLGGIFRLEQRIDGFVSADFAYTGGRLVTAPLLFSGNCLSLNVNTSAAGEGKVALLEANGDPIAGYGIDDCDTINGDYRTKLVSWRGNTDVSSLAGRPVRIEFVMRAAKLYAFQFRQQAPSSSDSSARSRSAASVDAETTTTGHSPLSVGAHKQLFIDHRFIDTCRNITLRLNPPQKLGIVIPPRQEPFEDIPGGFFKVIDDQGKFKMYYGGWIGGTKGLAYAESTDGIHWTKPALGVTPIKGDTRNNVLYADGTIDATIMVDPVDVPERRYKIFRSKISDDPDIRGVYASYSADGIHFTEAGRVFPMFPETSIVAEWDGRIKKYVVYLRVLNVGQDNLRAVGRLETDDLLRPWPYNTDAPPSAQPTPRHVPMVLSTDALDGPGSDFYTGGACIYPFAQDVYLMFPTLFRRFSPARQPWFEFTGTNGLLDVQVAVSRDGVNWSRPDRRPYLSAGLPDAWDRWMNMMGVGMVRKGSYLYQYYWSTGMLHDTTVLRPEYRGLIKPRNAIGAVRQRLDGFLSADAPYTGGWLTTPPLTFTGSCLRLNIDTGSVGTAFVELRHPDDRPIAGYTLEECEEVGGNALDSLVRWNGNDDLTPLIGKPVKLHFKMRAAKLYAFQFREEK